MIGFVRPWLLLLLLVLPFWWWRRSRQVAPAAIVSDTSPFKAAVRGRWRLRIPPALRSLAMAAFVLAAAGPVRPGDRVSISANGIAIVIALDISSSMLTEDFTPSNRIEVAKREAINFVNGRSADRIGLVIFAGEALTLVPVTLDYPSLVRAIQSVEIFQLEDGTAIGSGLATAVSRLRKVPAASRVVLLLTDGVNNRGLIDPRTAAETAAAFGIKVYTVGIGKEGEARVPTGKGPDGYHYETMQTEIDEPLLRDIAQRTGGEYFRARDSESLTRIFSEVNRLAKAPVDVLRYTHQSERTLPCVAAGLLCLAAELVVAGTMVVRVP
ncbi:MAG TPA: VWA domain-containing protein [Gemmatimonadales bacterium]|jgi:Ca-activated chloride channel family protein|nr:VWA domain-containing protein [Gemmatimonadales bacterium]